MINEKGTSEEIIERLFSSYGVTSQKDLAERLGIAANNISGWTKRGSVSGNAMIKCALDTGVDLRWLVTGEVENSHLQTSDASLKGKALYDQILASGGKAVLRRMMDAYGFSTQKELGDLLGISTATISTWVRRNFFPGDVVIACALDTGVSLEWLATGKGRAAGSEKRGDLEVNTNRLIPKYRLESGEMKEAGSWSSDLSMIPANSGNLIFVDGVSSSWLVDCSASKIGNGRWLISIDGALDVFDVIRLPGNKVRLSNKSAEFECNLSDITPSGAVIFTLEKHV
ncbi:phage repressor protein CI [Brenneria corticis]|uniref:Phage repressor protein CI n=1 Tax=Brenneria corticis TaxID=2173106 RepID=A0A2U1TJQ9_9GAMM|nr:phage repressor protein CI [Brenneria sp. CFCC 11842]PWC09599.1 phage repressor protein CI [Brenneria sp. CFCC 11842]